MKKRVRIHPVLWIPILVVIFLVGYKIREAYYSHEAHIKYVRNGEGAIEWDEMYKRVKNELNIKDDCDFYFRVERKEDSDIYDTNDRMFMTIVGNEKPWIDSSGIYNIMKEFKKDKYYIYYLNFWSDHIELEKQYPKLVDRISDSDFIGDFDREKVQREVPSGRDIFTMHDILQKELLKTQSYMKNGIRVFFTNKEIKSSNIFEDKKIKLINEDEEIITQEKELEEGVYLIAEIKSLDEEPQWIYYKIKK